MDAYEKNILSFGDQLSPKGLTLHRFDKLGRTKPDGVIILGIGGSGLAGDIVRAASDELRLHVPVILWKDYGLPKHSFRKPLYVFVSFSGNTEETLSGLPLAHRASRAVVTTGGKLWDIAERENLALARFPAGILTPRQSVGVMFYAITEILHAAGLMNRPRTFDHVNPRMYRASGRRLATKLRGRLLTIYTDNAHRHLGYIWKIKFNETSKAQAFNNVLPEMDHNELTAFDAPPKGLNVKRASIFLKDPKMKGRLEKKFKITEQLLKDRRNLVISMPLKGTSELEKAWHTLVLADWTSYFLGKLNGISEKEFNIVNPAIVIDLKRLMG